MTLQITLHNKCNFNQYHKLQVVNQERTLTNKLRIKKFLKGLGSRPTPKADPTAEPSLKAPFPPSEPGLSWQQLLLRPAPTRSVLWFLHSPPSDSKWTGPRPRHLPSAWPWTTPDQAGPADAAWGLLWEWTPCRPGSAQRQEMRGPPACRTSRPCPIPP